jgi:predicted nuclease of restriction endonuclease-like RecB superfamily
MVLRLQYLKYQISGSKLLPYFLDAEKDTQIASQFITFFEAQLGITKQDFDFDTPLTWVPDTRIARAIISTALNRYYVFIGKDLENLVTDEELSNLRHQGIGSLEDFRIWFWKFVENHQGGFIPQSKRDAVYSEASRILQLRSSSIEVLLTAHRDRYMVLERSLDTPSPTELIGAYNFEVFETLLYNCEAATITVKGESLGGTARALYGLTKRFGVLADFKISNGALRVVITGPRVFFGRASAFGWNIAQVLSRLLQKAGLLKIQIIDLTIDVILRDRHYDVRLSRVALPKLEPRGEARQDDAFLDSKVEKQFYWSWKNNQFRGWNVIREPDAIIINSLLMIPDFALIKGETKVLVEIIGYWREEYTTKKLEQLKLYQQIGLQNLILLVDYKHKRHFSKSSFPVVYYRSRGNRYEIPYGKILKYLQTFD